MNPENVQSLFGINIFSWENFDINEDTYQFINVQFFFESLKKYDGHSIEVTFDWRISVWGEGEVAEPLAQFSLMDVPEFQAKLKQLLS